MKAAVECDFLLKTQLNDPCRHNLIFFNTGPELLMVLHDFHNVLHTGGGTRVLAHTLEFRFAHIQFIGNTEGITCIDPSEFPRAERPTASPGAADFHSTFHQV